MNALDGGGGGGWILLKLLLFLVLCSTHSNAFVPRYWYPLAAIHASHTRLSTATSKDDYYRVEIPSRRLNNDDGVARDIINGESSGNTKKILENPMWPDGVSEEDIDVLVEDILADASINLPQLPDFLERQIYKTTTLLTLNAAYRLVGWVHGKRLWGHFFALTRRRCHELSRRTRQKQLFHMKTDVDEELLEQVADQLLANQAINQPLVPDVIERQLYVNCLKIIFRILNMLAASFRITVCGHDLTLNLEKAMDRESLKNVARTAASSQTPIDTAILRKVARAKMKRDQLEDDDDDEDEEDASLWKRGQQEFVVQVNTVLYSLILGILDDLLANTELVLFTDRIQFDILSPSEGAVAPRRKRKRRRRAIVQEKRRKPPILAFVLGAVVGIATGRFFF